ncbi:tRNA (adenosine(37)-N6)-threonylcarbamoyltransferase complex dimerization subunit type 1 TsaB [Brevundimonas goettingensis]|uniref:tRNA (Adenosine(37)-N6)-threonylcarbamoyltransferase complex dimerization subunit type 1 TsaB n=1 Tax=Brevundimonas goettingensis TaxID=2774190 RepID=A0A975BZU2_9CAUL|nr:tRNA (adenosine(37)-N6)-threonylcarbamoyltransferase complex dimerization subunit type 1 TsaB [Brevundimonas goettingensis]QTC90710.1 tRNA (adenosine(37)-N6)-threonylcarbamoyltransferase complex dimerization subunit type 1 TsaB [Brevundimonas goettingensis]
MKVLVIDTALNACTAAVFDGDSPLGVRVEPMAKGHQERIGGLVRDAVADAGGFDGIARIGVTVGPGSFTGLRVGLAFAQGLGAALGVPVVGISTLAALARSADGGAGATAAVIDARRGQVYLQTFQDGAPTMAPTALALDAARETLSGEDRIWAGSGVSLVTGALAAEPITVPTPEALAALTIAADPAEAPPTPLYLRAPDATPPTRLPGQARPPAARPAKPS